MLLIQGLDIITTGRECESLWPQRTVFVSILFEVGELGQFKIELNKIIKKGQSLVDMEKLYCVLGHF